MHKKEARKRKKLINQIRQHRVMPDGRVLTADGRVTLLGNLAPVKHIPMLPWKRTICLPTVTKNITVSTVGETAWFYELLKETSKKEYNLIGFTPVRSLDSNGFEDISLGKTGIAVEVRGIEHSDKEGTANVILHGICRYDIADFLPSAENHFEINVKWFEDNIESKTIVRPQFDAAMQIIERLAIAAGEKLYDTIAATKISYYDFPTAQALSFMMFNTFGEWFSEDDDFEILCLRSTSARLKKLNELAEPKLSEMEKRFRQIAKSGKE